MSTLDNTKIKAQTVIGVATSRMDCVAFVSPEELDCVSNNVPLTQSVAEAAVLDYRNKQLNKSSSYAFLDSGWKYQYDRYSDVYRWVPLNGDVAGIAVRSDENSETWFSPAGFNRGTIRGAVKLSFNPNQSQRDDLYAARVNPVVNFPGQGVTLFGDKTALTTPSSFDRINVVYPTSSYINLTQFPINDLSIRFTERVWSGKIRVCSDFHRIGGGFFDSQNFLESTPAVTGSGYAGYGPYRGIYRNCVSGTIV